MGGSVYDRNPTLKLDDCVAPSDITTDNVGTSKHGLLPRLDNDPAHCLNGDGTWMTPPGQVYDMSYPRRAGNDAWYSSPAVAMQLAAALTPTAQTAYAVPFIASKTITIDRIAVWVSTLKAGGTIELGIYNDPDDGTLYPGSVYFDAGFISTAATGLQALTINKQLLVGKLYWLVLVHGILGCVLKSFEKAAFIPFGGFDLSSASINGFGGWTVAQKFGGLPLTFPVGGTINSATTVPLIYVRLSVE
jgi:hypothetical protein